MNARTQLSVRDIAGTLAAQLVAGFTRPTGLRFVVANKLLEKKGARAVFGPDGERSTLPFQNIAMAPRGVSTLTVTPAEDGRSRWEFDSTWTVKVGPFKKSGGNCTGVTPPSDN
ncbi:hypothetical protein HOI18_03240 [Candidatus Uhrbacteria bacterium]|nr:hypothetical protein [Candidatus Uhrbacteria bacterium]